MPNLHFDGGWTLRYDENTKMSLGCFITRFLVVTGLALAAILSAPAQQSPPKRGRSIQFSEPKSDVVSSNLNQLSEKKPTLRSLEEDLKKPFELLNPADDSLTGIFVPPVRRTPPAATKSKRERERSEQHNDWPFLAPEDYEASGLTAEEIFNFPEYGPNGEVKKKRTPLEKYYNRLEKARSGDTNEMRGEGDSRPHRKGEDREETKEFNSGGEVNPLSSGLSDLEQTVRRLSNPNSANTPAPETTPPNGFSDIFGFGKTESPEQVSEKFRAHEKSMEAFKQLLENRPLASPNSGAGAFNPLGGSPSPVAPGGFNAFSSPGSGSAPSSLAPTLGSPSLLPGLPSVPTSPGLPSWQMPPPATPPSHLPFTPPTFNIPQRKF